MNKMFEMMYLYTETLYVKTLYFPKDGSWGKKHASQWIFNTNLTQVLLRTFKSSLIWLKLLIGTGVSIGNITVIQFRKSIWTVKSGQLKIPKTVFLHTGKSHSINGVCRFVWIAFWQNLLIKSLFSFNSYA